MGQEPMLLLPLSSVLFQVGTCLLYIIYLFFLDCNVELKMNFFICGDLKGGIRSDGSYNLFNGNFESYQWW